MQDQDRIRQRAHEIWEREGRPEGHHDEHWAQASQEIAAESGASPSDPAAPDEAPTLAAGDGAGATPAQAAAAANAVGAPRKAE